jgi:UDP-glucose 4-epimerase
MRILVTGGCGFIGSHIVDRLLHDGHDVTVIDNLTTGRHENLSDAAHFFTGDVARVEDVEEAFSGGFDAIFHIAGQVSLIRSFTHPVIDLRTNVQGTINVLQMCIKYRVPRLLYASSMTVYADDVPLPTAEAASCAPASYYGITKYAAERYVMTTAQRVDLDFDFAVTAFRMYNVYGPRQALDNPYQGVLGIFLGQLLRGEPITIFGDGEQSRDFIYITDIVDAWAGALENRRSYGTTFNLGGGHQVTINALADAALSAFDRSRTDYRIVYKPARPGEQRRVEADISRARQSLSWSPRVSFEEGLSQSVRWARARAAESPAVREYAMAHEQAASASQTP